MVPDTSLDDSCSKASSRHSNDVSNGTPSHSDGYSASSSAGDREIQHFHQTLASRETKWLRWSKCIFLFILMIAAALSTWIVYRVSRNQEEEAYKTRFNDFANEVIAVSNLHASAVVDAYDTLALTVTATVNASAWPNVVVPHFEGLAQNVMSYTDATFVTLIPLVFPDQKESYETFVLEAAPQWIQEAADFSGVVVDPNGYVPFIYELDENEQVIPGIPRTTSYSPEVPYYFVVHQAAPVEEMIEYTNYNALTVPVYMATHNAMITSKKATLSPVRNYDGNPEADPSDWPTGYLATPVYRDIDYNDESNDMVGVITGSIGFQAFFRDLLPEGTDPLYVVIRNGCNQTLTYLIEGPDVIYLGTGDLHESRTDIQVSAEFDAFETMDDCKYTFHLHPSFDFYESYHSTQPVINALAIGMTFFATAVLFFLYDILVELRQNRVLKTATRSVAIVSSLFPTKVRDRLMQEEEKATSKSDSKLVGRVPFAIGSLHASTKSSHLGYPSKPIADLFPNASVLFADVVGFTAWASMREPTQVFELLESVYSSFDKLAKKLGVFKVETIGDCYVAACGLPEPKTNHAVIITRFARLCLERMREVVAELATHLGPDTSSLTLRIGIHAGPVTAGVLRGEKSRFQLFGDTVNTASRIESTGMPNRIQVSQEMADELVKAGKESWIVERTDMIEAKGKGQLQTHWVVTDETKRESENGGVSDRLSIPSSHRSSLDLDLTASVSSASSIGEGVLASEHQLAKTTDQSIEISWNADVLKMFLEKIMNTRNPCSLEDLNKSDLNKLEFARQKQGAAIIYPLEEVQEVITLPRKSMDHSQVETRHARLKPNVVEQVEDYVATIASMYQSNPFHNFAHASHVVQSTMKLLNRIVASEKIDYEEMAYRKQTENSCDERSFGITSDPLTQFACVFAALIHDVDHSGVPNAQLVAEETRLARAYKSKSVAEQNSLDLAWDLLMEDRYEDLRACIYTNEAEFVRFRQLLVNMVMATDIMDKDLKELHNTRWNKAFQDDSLHERSKKNCCENRNRMATIVIEHLIQASDVAHTMQHWHVYIRWNERLFHEMYKAFKLGRAASDPSLNWYKGELGFFDFYIIPLAKKLKECKIFGVSSDEYLNYAKANRKEWEARGQDMVTKYLASYSGP